jgi:hypothetical protein
VHVPSARFSSRGAAAEFVPLLPPSAEGSPEGRAGKRHVSSGPMNAAVSSSSPMPASKRDGSHRRQQAPKSIALAEVLADDTNLRNSGADPVRHNDPVGLTGIRLHILVEGNKYDLRTRILSGGPQGALVPILKIVMPSQRLELPHAVAKLIDQ